MRERVLMPFVTRAGSTSPTWLRPSRLHVLRDLDLAVEQGEMVAIVGRVGRGEEHAAARARRARSARFGRRAGRRRRRRAVTDAELVAFRNRHVGFVFQFHHLLPEFSAIENAEMPLRIARVKTRDARPRAAGPARRASGLASGSIIGPGMLSGGEQQRVAVARALVMQPSLLLADEPTGDLDETTADALHALLREMHAEFGLTAIIATHNPRLAQQCDRICGSKPASCESRDAVGVAIGLESSGRLSWPPLR